MGGAHGANVVLVHLCPTVSCTAAKPWMSRATMTRTRGVVPSRAPLAILGTLPKKTAGRGRNPIDLLPKAFFGDTAHGRKIHLPPLEG